MEILSENEVRIKLFEPLLQSQKHLQLEKDSALIDIV